MTLAGSYYLTVTDTLPVGTTYVGATGDGWTCSQVGGVIACTRATLAPGAAPAIVITATAPLATGFITNTAAVGSNISDTDPANNSTQFTTNIIGGGPTYGVMLIPGAIGQAGLQGTVVTYTLNVTNTGNAIDTFTVTMSGNSFVTNAPANVGPLAAGVSTAFNVVVTIPGSAAAGTIDTAIVTLKSQGDNSASASASLSTTAQYSVYLPVILR